MVLNCQVGAYMATTAVAIIKNAHNVPTMPMIRPRFGLSCHKAQRPSIANGTTNNQQWRTASCCS